MRRAIIALLVLACGGKGGGGAVAEPGTTARPRPPAELVSLMLKRLRDEACAPGSRYKVWCQAAESWDAGTAAEPPPGVYAGVNVGLLEDEPVDRTLDEVFLTAMAIDRDAQGGLKLLITDVAPSGTEERAMADRATEAVLEAARAGGAARIAAPLHDYLKTIPGNARRALTRGERGWAMENARYGELRRAGNRWVAIEVPSEGPPGIFLSVFIDEVSPE